ncbi:pyridoxal phosphate-dependent decarboxylase family protein [Longimicrobium sp.]|uniref:pyridoxal phosphate-dependent decarboxylase family protein n=1 Tax=Longimicrobium sp. TaxID=2029185 RepID=UPI002BD8E820|nr:pyridoxal-dependent decarboxylase [Longimicrobium sp.]HSU15702.1 pyridoxal-dependent decarboxylase [Longimicrobium sp.]
MTDYSDSPRREAPVDLASVFLGPKAENADVFERLLLEAVRDHVFWRRNFHPEDGFEVTEAEKRTPAYERSITTLAQELMGLLGELKAGVPFFSPRYIGHMSSDLTMASLVGYFATMLYNPNNVAAEASPVTTRMELEVAGQLARMIGYDPARQWGHLTSGGTVANFEALWVARNVKYLPVAVRWAADELGLAGIGVRLPGGEGADLRAMDLWQLLNVAPEASLDLLEHFRDRVGDGMAAANAVTRHSLAGLGYQEFGRRLATQFGDAFPPAAVLVPSTAHYSWEKICRALGIGGAQLVHVPVDARFRMDPDALRSTLGTLAGRRQPVIACVSVIGTTEESAVDRLDLVAEVRDEAARRHGIAFHLHADAAWGGYAASITRGADGERRSYERALADYAPEPWPQEGVYRALVALERTDSVTIDPHKLGFIPYPAGAVSFRDLRVRDLVAVEAPYVFHAGGSDASYIGRFIFEGSKPGAAAAAVWMSHKVLPPDARGYGRLVGETARGALLLHRRIAAGDWAPFRLVALPEPDLNIVCFAIGHPSLVSLEETNALADRVYGAMSVSAGRSARDLEYVVTKTVLRAHEYGRAAEPVVRELGFTYDDYERAGGVGVIRCTVMDPFFAARRGKEDFVAGFAKALRKVLEQVL